MTNKRFQKNDTNTYYDSQTDTVLKNDDIIDLLNEYWEKIQKLEQERNDCEKFRYAVFEKINELNTKEVKKWWPRA